MGNTVFIVFFKEVEVLTPMHTSILLNRVSPVVSASADKAFASSNFKLINNNHVVSLLTHRAGHSYDLHCYYICLVKNACYITHHKMFLLTPSFPHSLTIQTFT